MNKFFVLTVPLLLVSAARAQTNTSTLSQELKNKTFKENTDITDAKLKADAGSLSRYSMKFNLNYSGPTLGDLSRKDQPNPDGSIGSFQTALGGNIGARFRLSSKSTIGVASGMKILRPFHGADRTDLSNPSASFDYSFRAADIQMKHGIAGFYRTVPEFKKVGQYGMLLDSHSMVYDIGHSGFAVGTDLGLAYFLYDRDYRRKDGKASRYSFEVNPNLKYNFSDKLNVFTSSNISLWNPRSRKDQYVLLNKSMSQRVGMGYAFNRDTYFNPFLAFYPQHLALSAVTLNFSTIFSVF